MLLNSFNINPMSTLFIHALYIEQHILCKKIVLLWYPLCTMYSMLRLLVEVMWTANLRSLVGVSVHLRWRLIRFCALGPTFSIFPWYVEHLLVWGKIAQCIWPYRFVLRWLFKMLLLRLRLPVDCGWRWSAGGASGSAALSEREVATAVRSCAVVVAVSLALLLFWPDLSSRFRRSPLFLPVRALFAAIESKKHGERVRERDREGAAPFGCGFGLSLEYNLLLRRRESLSTDVLSSNPRPYLCSRSQRLLIRRSC